MASLFPPRSTPEIKYPGPVLGSDFPVEPPNPFHGLYAAVTRLSPATGTSPAGEKGWHPEEALTVEQALLGFTRNAAYGWFREDNAGAIEAGKWADWVVVDRNLWEDDSGKSLRDVVVLETWMGGHRVYPPESVGGGAGWLTMVVADIQAIFTRGMQWLSRDSGDEL